VEWGDTIVKWTKEQESAIYTEGSDILVSAAAGSGKTAVLVERIIQKLLKKDNPVDIDSLLVVTFTNAAAQEMRARVGLALEEALAKDPTSLHLKKQLSLLQRASISTLHSFCLDTLKQYAYLIDLDPTFRIANDVENEQIKQEVIEDLFEEWYGNEDEEQDYFFEVVDRFSSDRSDIEVEELILKLFTFATQHPWPDVWLDQVNEAYDIPHDWKEEDLDWLNIIKKEVNLQLEAMHQELILAESLVNESDGPYQYADAIESDKQMLNKALESIHVWDDLQAVMASSKFVNLSGKKTECNEEKKEKAKSLRNSYKSRWNKMKEDWFGRHLHHHVKDMQELAPVIKQLTILVKAFKQRYTAVKKEKGLVDFSDLEHYCLEILIDSESTPENPLPSDIAKNLQGQYSELLVDEYQDTNLVQETLLRMISDQIGPGNMFMVGDVKQSIYRFRHAEPSLFIDKYKRFKSLESLGQRIDLSSNFRSREHVLSGANYIFRQILDETIGEIDYDTNAELIYANKMYDEVPHPAPHPELMIIDREDTSQPHVNDGEDDDSRQELEKAQLEARAYAKNIKLWLGDDDNKSLQVVDKETQAQRDIQYRDIVILMRSMTDASTVVDEFKKQGIPVYAELNTGYFEAIEIKIMISFLKVIDNPRQDIPLASVLRSPIIGLDEEELANIRLVNQRDSYYNALKQFEKHQSKGETRSKVKRFLDLLQLFRREARQGALSELIWSIYRETGYYDFVGGMPGGRQRQANLRALYDRARGYETTSYRGLFRFLRFIERMEESGDDLGAAGALSEQEDVVRIMTIHKSKGLEFPVVIVGGMAKTFNFQDIRGRYILHKDLGFASKYIDPVKRITFPTLFFHALKQEKHREMLAEEMRVLYVALTRAKEKLVMVANVPSFEKIQAKWQATADHSEWILPAHIRGEAKTYLDWIGPALIRHQDSIILRTEEIHGAVREEIQIDPSKWDITVVHKNELEDVDVISEEVDFNLQKTVRDWQTMTLEDSSLSQQVSERLSYQYPYLEAASSRAKQTVTEIKRLREYQDEYSSNQLIQPYKAPIVKRPTFLQKEKQLSSAEIGTAMHTVMQHLPFKTNMSSSDIEDFVDGLVIKEILTEAEAEIINIQDIEQFLQTDIAGYMRSQSFYRELPFSLTLPANEVYTHWQSGTEEQVLIQGVLDCVIPKDGGWVILDYKTDAVEDEVDEKLTEKLIKRYETQMNLYRRAIESIWKQPVIGTYLYFFTKQLLIDVPIKQNEK